MCYVSDFYVTCVCYQEAYDSFLPDAMEEARTPKTLLQAVADRDGVSVELLDILLKCEHLYNALCKTVWSEDESWEDYVERVRVYDPTAHTFKRIHFALLFAHGLKEQSDPDPPENSCYRMRPAPSQLNLIHGQTVPLRRLTVAGLRMINVNEGHLEHRHMLRKILINLNCLHQIAMGIGKNKDKCQDQETTTHDQIRRNKQLLLQQHLQQQKMWFSGVEAFKKNPWSSRYLKQVVYQIPTRIHTRTTWMCINTHINH